jgi:glycosyltransferase involved in cell wall biosynthesis
MCDALAAAGVDVHLVAGRPADQQVACGWPADARRVHAVRESPRMRAWGIGDKFRKELADLCDGAAGGVILHDHGVWLATNHAVAAFARKAHVVRVVSPRGMLSTWAMQRGWLKKRAAWLAYQRRDLESVTAFHATSDAEAAEIRALGFTQPIAVIPNGVAFPEAIERTAGANGRRTMLFLSRIHPKKGLENLLRAWHAAAPPAEWRLVIAGPDEGGHRAEIERVVAEQGLGRRVEFPGEISDADKWRWYAAADVFVLPSFSENFGLVVGEALAAGTPAITTTGSPWREAAAQGAGWEAEPTVAGLTAALRAAIACSDRERAAMGARGSLWVRRRFAWRGAAERMREFYAELGGLAPPPR